MMKLINTLKSLLLLSIFVFVGCGSSFGMYQYFKVGFDSVSSDWNNQYDINFLKKGVLNSSYLGDTKKIIALDNQYLLFWNQYGLYLYNYYSNKNVFGLIQGYFQYIYSCDEITEDGDSISNCSSAQNVLGNDEIVQNFLNNISFDDWVYIYDEVNNISYFRYRLAVCFSSKTIGKTLCFAGDRSQYGDCSDYYCSSQPFTGSMNFDTGVNFGNINRGILFNPPGFIAGGSDGTGSSVGNVVVSSPCPSVGQIQLSQEQLYNYNSSLCYSPTKIISIQGEPTVNEVPSQSIFELYPSFTGFNEDLSLFNSCNSNSNLHCFDVFSGKDINYWFLNNYVKTVKASKPGNFYNYCNSVINLDPSWSSCVVSTGAQILPGTEFSSQEEMINELINSLDIYNYNTYNWGSSGENKSGFDLKVLSDAWSGVNELFTSFNYIEGVNGIFPKYIVIGFLGILLLYVFKR